MEKEIEGSLLSAASNGKAIYYGRQENGVLYLYQMGMRGGSKRYIGAVKGGLAIQGCYKKELFVSVHDVYDNTLLHMYRVNIETGKRKKIAENLVFTENYGKYYWGSPNTGAPIVHEIKVYNAHTGKLKTVTKKNIGYGDHKQTLYFTQVVSEAEGENKWSFVVKKYHLKTGKKVTISPRLEAVTPYVEKINHKYVVFQTENGFYKYSYKSKKLSKTKSPYL